MRLANSLKRFRQFLRPSSQRQLRDKFQSRLRLEELEGRMLLSTLFIDASSNAVFTGGSTIGDNVTLSDHIVQTPFFRLAQRTFTDPVEIINVTGPGAGGVTGGGTHSVTWTRLFGVGSITVNMSAINDSVAVQANDVVTTVTPSGLGKNTVTLGSAANHGVQALFAPVTVGAGFVVKTDLIVDDAGDGAVKSNVGLNSTSITNLAPAAISFAAGNLTSLTVSGGSGNNTYTVFGTAVPTTLNTGSGKNQVFVEATGAPLTIQGHGGTDFVDVSSNPTGLGSLANIHGNVDVRNTTPSTELFVDDSADPSTLKQNVSLSDTALVGLAPAPITYQPGGLSTFISLFVTGRENFDDTYTVTNTPGTTHLGLGKGSHQVNVQGLTGQLIIADRFGQNTATTVVVGSNAPGSGGTLAKVNGLLTFENGLTTGTSQLIVDDSADATSRTVNLTAAPFGGKITGLAPGATILYSAVSAIDLAINGGSGGNTFNLANPAPSQVSLTTLNGGVGGDTFNVAAAPSNLDITTGSGSNHLNIQGNGPNDSMNIHARAGQNTITIGSLAPALGGNLTNVHGGIFLDEANSSTALIMDDSSDPAFQNVILNKGVVSNVIDFSTIGPFGTPIDFPAGLKSVDVFGGKGGDRFTILNPPSTPVTIHGGSGSNTLVGGNVPNLWNITSTNAGQVGSVAFTSIQNLVGGTSTDTFRFSNGAGVTGFIDGGASFNVLDYSAYTTRVSVNLGAHTATGVGGGVFDIQGVIGGTGGNTLISGPSGAVLIGGTGGNVLLGGPGPDVLIAGPGSSVLQAGSGEAILIGGTTIFDNDVAALSAIMAEWSRPIPYALRVNDLFFGGGLNGPFRLNPTTVHSNGAHDVLTTGLGLDFVFFDSFDTLTHAPRPGEKFVKV